jgi:2,3-bisphosphoglycerate-independent phosphoglycerate mutase
VIDESSWQLSCIGGLSNVAPTVLHLMGLRKPEGMTARSLLLKPVHSLHHFRRGSVSSAA